MCAHAVDNSFRVGCEHFNNDYHRGDANTTLDPVSFRDIVVREGQLLIKAIRERKAQVFREYGFTDDGMLIPGTELRPELCNANMEWIVLNTEEIMSKGPSLWQNTMPAFKEGEFAQPETGLHPRLKTRRSSRFLVCDKNREAALRNYIWNVNTQADREQGAMIRHTWEIEKYAGQIVNIFIDGDIVPEQAEKRIPGGKPVPRTDRTNVKHIDIRLEMEDGSQFNITSTDIDDAYQQLLACLLANHLTSRYLQFFIDGETILFEYIEKYFKHWHYRIFLDFYHVEEKIKTLLSSAIISKRVNSPWEEPTLYVNGSKKGEIKKQPKTSLSMTYASVVARLVWYGNIEGAVEYVKHINPDDIHNEEKYNELLTYFKNKGQMMTCYALRARAGLKNSSNASELSNELMVSSRQKVDDRMHWREDGSTCLANLSALHINYGEDEWFGKRTFSFTLYQATPTKVVDYAKPKKGENKQTAA